MIHFRILVWLVPFLFVTTIAEAGSWDIKKGSGLSEIKQAVALAADYDTLYVHEGLYLESKIEIHKPLSLIGVNNPIIDSEDGDEIFVVFADDVQISGFTLKNIGVSYIEDRAAIKLNEIKRAIIEDNRLVNAFFGIYIKNSTDCIIRNNVIKGEATDEVRAGNAIHAWKSNRLEIYDNEVTHHRDGIYLEFVNGSQIKGNLSQNNMRYGLHFMFSNYNSYENNAFEKNGAGVAVMFSKHIEMINNVFTENWGGSAYGVLLKEISDGLLLNNTFVRNTIGVYAEGANRIVMENNDFISNGKAMDIKGNCMDNKIIANNFIGNTFEVLTNSRSNLNHFEGNYWGQYKGYDLDKDGIGDVPHRPVNLFALVTDRIPAANMLLHSFLVNGLEVAERLFPSMIPEHLIDERPLIKPRKND
ncbi:MAG TPA: nitrous oxide reductase family maturation protein NosD [Cyclobacteriaceae bacterium]|nr:nitrous oxide reductase family maturation protein NosD [Cyclobacteriaceae bacterium]